MIVGINGSFLRKKDSGIGQVSWNFLENLSKKSKSVRDIRFIIYLEEDVDLNFPKGFEKKVVLTPYKRDDLLRKLLWEKIALPQEAMKDKCDVFFSLYQSASIIPGIPHLMLVHDAVWKVFPEYLNNFRKKVYYFFVEKAILRANKILTVSKFSQKEIKRIFKINKKKIDFTYIDCDPIFEREAEEFNLDKVLAKYNISADYIFYVGGFDVRKNVKRLIWAYGNFWKNYNQGNKAPDLVLAGSFHENLVPLVDDVPNEIEEVSREFGVPKEKIKMIGFVDQFDLPVLYSKSKMLCYPSLYEGFGLPVLEAMKVGCPVVTSNVSSIIEIANVQNSFMVDPKNINEISKGISDVLDEKKVQEKREQAQKDSQKFSWGKFTEKVLEEISNIN